MKAWTVKQDLCPHALDTGKNTLSASEALKTYEIISVNRSLESWIQKESADTQRTGLMQQVFTS